MPATPQPHEPLTRLDYSLFRQKLAGVLDPERHPGATEKEEIRQISQRLCCVLAHLYDVAGDRSEIWAHIHKSIHVALNKLNDDDLDRFVSLCLEGVQANPVRSAACEALLHLLETFQVRPPEWRNALLAYLRTHLAATVVHGRARWARVKSGEVAL